MRPDGSSTVSVINGESLSAELAHELMSIQVIPKRDSFLFVLRRGLGDELESEERFRVSLHDYMKTLILVDSFCFVAYGIKIVSYKFLPIALQG